MSLLTTTSTKMQSLIQLTKSITCLFVLKLKNHTNPLAKRLSFRTHSDYFIRNVKRPTDFQVVNQMLKKCQTNSSLSWLVLPSLYYNNLLILGITTIFYYGFL